MTELVPGRPHWLQRNVLFKAESSGGNFVMSISMCRSQCEQYTKYCKSIAIMPAHVALLVCLVMLPFYRIMIPSAI